MQDRLERFVDDRTRMLAAISHDLRTPITSLRLRAEMVEDMEAREAMLRTLADMQTMVEATSVCQGRGDRGKRPAPSIWRRLLDSLCDDLAAIGKDVTFVESDERLAIACRPTALGRALRNPDRKRREFGARARVSVRREIDAVVVEIDDDGPGIAEADRARVFEPFVRLEASRSKQTRAEWIEPVDRAHDHPCAWRRD